MGLFLCSTCNEHLPFPVGQPHVCDPEKIWQYVQRLKRDAQIAEHRLGQIQDAVMKLIQPLASLEGPEVVVATEWVRKLWDAANNQWHEAKTADSFLVHWLATHRVLCEAFDVFRRTRNGKQQTLLEKLQELREACDRAKETLGYQNSKFDMTPQELLLNLISPPQDPAPE